MNDVKNFKWLGIILLTSTVLVACGVEPAVEIEEPTPPSEESHSSELEDD